MDMEVWGLHLHKPKLMYLFHVGNGRWGNQKPVNFLGLNARFQSGLELIPNLNQCNRNPLQITQMQV